jgi:hypothetical protein
MHINVKQQCHAKALTRAREGSIKQHVILEAHVSQTHTQSKWSPPGRRVDSRFKVVAAAATTYDEDDAEPADEAPQTAASRP